MGTRARQKTLSEKASVRNRNEANSEGPAAPALLELSVESIADGILAVDKQGEIAMFNQRFPQMWNVPDDLIASRDTDRIVAHMVEQLKHPDYSIAETRQALRDGSEGYDIVEFKDGRIFERHCLPQYADGVMIGRVWSFRDITARKNAAEALKRIERRFKAIADTATDAIITVNVEGDAVFWNKAAERLFGYKRSEIVGRNVRLIVPRHLRSEHLKGLADLAGQKRRRPLNKTFETVGLNREGTCFPIEIALAAWGSSGESFFTAIIRDISDRKRSREALKRSFARLQSTLSATVDALGTMAEQKDPYIAGHQRRVARLACALASEMGYDDRRLDAIRVAAVLHDIGKINVPAEILSKPARLSIHEFNLIKAHPSVGYEILKSIPFIEPVAKTVLQHQERLDGSGYPHGLYGDQILPEARIVSVADVVEAMASHRPYRPALGIEKALQEIAINSGKLYDERVAQACLRLFKRGYVFE